MVSAINSALAGINNAASRVETAARNIANQGASRAPSSQDNRPVDRVELSAQALEQTPQDSTKDLVDLQVASNDYKANLRSLKVADNISRSLLDILA